MDMGQASQTAALTATLRAAHQLIDGEPKVLTDPLAIGLVDDARPERIEPRRAEFGAPTLRVLRSAVVLRSRFTEDQLGLAVERGNRQYVILGAGLDTFPYRQPPFARQLQIFEVDHPATQAWKRERLTAVGITVPANLHWAPIDFERATLAEGLLAAGLDRERPAFFSWLGVTQYLTLSAIDSTLRVVASLPAPTTIVLSFMLPDENLTGDDLEAARSVAETAAATGEPWRTRFRPQELCTRLAGLGFSSMFHLTPEEATARYFAGRQDGLRAPDAAQLVSASS
jgi:methyltransferase (TIGR00027 family)